LAFHALEVNSL